MLLALASRARGRGGRSSGTYRYMWVADIKILDALMITRSSSAVAALAFVLSMLFGPVWCRYLCPVGGLYSIFGMASPCTVVRDDEACIHCSRCTRVCHAFVDVEHAEPRCGATECDGCMDCVRVCPAPGALQAKALGLVRIPPQVWPLLVVGLWLGIYAVAKVTGHWDTTIPVERLPAGHPVRAARADGRPEVCRPQARLRSASRDGVVACAQSCAHDESGRLRGRPRPRGERPAEMPTIERTAIHDGIDDPSRDVPRASRRHEGRRPLLLPAADRSGRSITA